MKKFIIASIFLLCISAVSFAQTTDIEEETPLKRNSLYLELGGNSIYYSLNYDNIIADNVNYKVTIGVGIAYLRVSETNADKSGHAVSAAPNINFLFGKKSHHFEAGASFQLATPNLTYLTVVPGARIGYRYQPAKGGFMFRAGFTPLLVVFNLVPWGGISFGYTF